MAKGSRRKVKLRRRKPRKAPRPAARDNFGREFLKLKGTVDPDIDLEF